LCLLQLLHSFHTKHVKELSPTRRLCGCASAHLSPWGLVGISWSVTNVPLIGSHRYHIPILPSRTPLTKPATILLNSSILMANPTFGYTGLQPRPDSNGKPCHPCRVSPASSVGLPPLMVIVNPGADGGPGVSCSVGVFPRRTQMRISLWFVIPKARRGMVQWLIPPRARACISGPGRCRSGSQGIKRSQLGFVEYYPWNDGQEPSLFDVAVYVRLFFGVPKTTTRGAVGSLGEMRMSMGIVWVRLHLRVIGLLTRGV